MLNEIIKSCVNPSVAEAAVCSIGVKFARDILAAAARREQSRGAYVARVVRDFGVDADSEARRRLMLAINRSDQPVLAGLKLILTEAMRDDGPEHWPVSQPAMLTARSCCAGLACG